MTKLAKDGDMEAYQYSEVKRWTKKVPGRNIFNLHKVFVPINSNNRHWSCIIVNMTKRTITYYDSLHYNGDKYLRVMEKYLQDEWQNTTLGNPPTTPWILSDNGTNTPYQGNGYDCGVFVCRFAVRLHRENPAEAETFCADRYRKTVHDAIVDPESLRGYIYADQAGNNTEIPGEQKPNKAEPIPVASPPIRRFQTPLSAQSSPNPTQLSSSEGKGREELITKFLTPQSQRATRPHWKQYAEYSDRNSELHRLCIWGENAAMGVFRGRLKSLISDITVRVGIIKCRRVQQPDGHTRYDVFILKETLDRVDSGQIMDEASRQFNWKQRRHLQFNIRNRLRSKRSPMEISTRNPGPNHQKAKPTHEVRQKQPLSLGSLNINGINSKRTGMKFLLQLANFDCLCLQETKQRPGDWQLKFSGYTSFVSMGDHGANERGLGILVRNRFDCRPIGKASAFWQFVEVSGRDLDQPVILGNTYIPTTSRKQVLHKLSLAINQIRCEYNNHIIFLGGDFNTTPEVLETYI